MNTDTIIAYIANRTGRDSDQVRAVVNHITDTELRSVPEEHRVYGAREEAVLAQSVMLGEEDRSRIEDLPDEVYEYLLYYYMMRINNKFLSDDGVVYVDPEIIDDNGEVTSDYTRQFDHGNLGTAMDLIESDERPTDDFPMTLAYSGQFDRWLAEYPLWSELHSEISKVYMSHPRLRFNDIEADNVKRTLQEEGRRRLEFPNFETLNNFDEFRYYTRGLAGIYDYDGVTDKVPVSEQLMQLTKFPGGGAFGDTYVARFGVSIPMFAKSQSFDRVDVIHEYRVGSGLNRYYDQCPFFMYTYGLSNAYMQPSGDGLVQVYDNVSRFSTDEREDVHNVPVVLFQWINRSISMSNFINSRYTTFRLEGDQIVPVPFGESVRQMLLAIMATLKFLNDKVGFSHGDLHFQNIQILRLQRPAIIELPGYPGAYYNSDHIPIIIDYGYASLSKLGVHSKSRGVNIPTNDRRLKFDDHYVMDVDKMYKIIIRNRDRFQGVMTNREYDDFIDDLTRFHFVAITGSMLPDEDLSRVRRSMESLVADPPNDNNAFYRTLPMSSTKYDPDAAVDFLMDVWYPRDPLAMDLELSTVSPPNIGSIPRLLRDRLSSEGVFRLDTYTGALAVHQHPTFRNVPQVLEVGVGNSVNVLNCLNRNQLIQLLEVSQGLFSRTDKILKFIYRRQILRYINNYIRNNIVDNSEGRSNNKITYNPPTVVDCSALIRAYDISSPRPVGETYSIMASVDGS